MKKAKKLIVSFCNFFLAEESIRVSREMETIREDKKLIINGATTNGHTKTRGKFLKISLKNYFLLY